MLQTSYIPVDTYEILATPLKAMVIEFVLVGHPVIISTELLRVLTTGSRAKDFYMFATALNNKQ